MQQQELIGALQRKDLQNHIVLGVMRSKMLLDTFSHQVQDGSNGRSQRTKYRLPKPFAETRLLKEQIVFGLYHGIPEIRQTDAYEAEFLLRFHSYSFSKR